MSSRELETLLQVLDERGIALGSDDVAWAFESSKTREDMKKWAREYLNPATLLTREELHFCNSNVGSTTMQDGGSEISDEAFEIAISALEASTASIEKQCRVLEAQKRAIEDIVRRNSSTKAGSHDRTELSKAHSHQKAQLDFEQAELAQSLQSGLAASTKQSQAQVDSISSSVEKMLEKDDRVFDGLEKLIPQLLESDGAVGQIGEVDQLCHALSLQSIADIRTRIDAAYTAGAGQASALVNGSHKESDARQTEKQRQALRSELDELCREIDGLSTMAVDSQYRNPITRLLDATKEESQVEKNAWSEYLNSVLHYLTSRLDSMESHSQHLHAHRGALRTVSTALGSVLGADTDKKQTPQIGSPSPSKQSQKGLKPLKLVQANLSENQDPVFQLLKQLDVRLSTPASDTAKLSESLSAAVTDQRAKLASSASGLDRIIPDQIAKSLASVEGEAQALLSAVFAPSEYGTVRLLASGTQDRIEDLEEKTQRMGEEMRKLDVNEITADLREKQQAIMQRLR